MCVDHHLWLALRDEPLEQTRPCDAYRVSLVAREVWRALLGHVRFSAEHGKLDEVVRDAVRRVAVGLTSDDPVFPEHTWSVERVAAALDELIEIDVVEKRGAADVFVRQFKAA